jgi:hypothetical protein
MRRPAGVTIRLFTKHSAAPERNGLVPTSDTSRPPDPRITTLDHLQKQAYYPLDHLKERTAWPVTEPTSSRAPSSS